MKKLNLAYWHAGIIFDLNLIAKFFTSKYFKVGNAGDLFACDLVRHLYGDIKIVNIPSRPRLFLVGSILSWPIKKDDVVYGIGFKKSSEKINKIFNSNAIYSLRGPHSSKRVFFNSANLSMDPGTLVREVYGESIYENESFPQQSKTLHIPIHSKRYDKYNFPFNFDFCDIDDHPINVVRRISKYERVVTSSLHGYIFARCLGKKVCAYYDESNFFDDNYFKWIDFFSSINEEHHLIHVPNINDNSFISRPEINQSISDFNFPSKEFLIDKKIIF